MSVSRARPPLRAFVANVNQAPPVAQADIAAAAPAPTPCSWPARAPNFFAVRVWIASRAAQWLSRFVGNRSESFGATPVGLPQ
jgi:hypothetical protein